MNTFNVGDVVKINPNIYTNYYTISKTLVYTVSATHQGSNSQLIELEEVGTAKFSAKNFILVRESENPNQKTFKYIVSPILYFQEAGIDEPQSLPDLRNSKSFSTERLAKEWVQEQIELNPELVFLVFELKYKAFKEKPPIKFQKI